MARRSGLVALVAVALTPAAHAAPPPLQAVASAGPRLAWVGGAGAVLGTADGGRTWRRQWSGRATVTTLDAVDPNDVFALAGGTLLRTADGGARWLRTPGSGLSAIDFVTPSTGYALDRRGSVMRTDDSGLHWRDLPLGASSVCFADASRGWAADDRTVLETRNGGDTWRPVYRLSLKPEGGTFATQLACAGGRVWALFSQPIGMSQSAQVLVRGPAPWRPVLAEAQVEARFKGLAGSTDAQPGPLVAAGAGAIAGGVCAPCDPTLSVTRLDGSRTRLPLHGLGPFALSFADARHGYAAATSDNSGAVLVTADGGRTWRGVLGLTQLAVSVRPHGAEGPTESSTLRCDPAGGTHRHAAEACAELAAHAQRLAPPAGPCTQLPIRGARDGRISGTYLGASVDRLVRPVCDGALWSAFSALLRG